jgi:glucan 1,3-beta-glucosidase
MSGPIPEDSIPPTPDVFSGTPGATNSWTSPEASSGDVPLVAGTEKGGEKISGGDAAGQTEPRRSLFKRPILWLAVVAALVIVALAVILPVYFTVIKPKNNTSSGGNSNGGSNNNTSGNPKSLTTGGDGSTVTTENGTQFTYHNQFGGFCVSNPFPS